VFRYRATGVPAAPDGVEMNASRLHKIAASYRFLRNGIRACAAPDDDGFVAGFAQPLVAPCHFAAKRSRHRGNGRT
jgi:hypothetical protein